MAENIISIADDTPGLLAFENDGVISITDGVNTASVDIDYQANIKYYITAIWGPNPDFAGANKMQLKVTDGTTEWNSAVVDFDGSFNPGDDLSFAWENIYPQSIKITKIAKEPEW